MIFDSLSNLDLYASTIPAIKNILSLLNSGNIDLSKGAHKTSIPKLRYNVAEYSTIETDKEFEIHKKEIDVQIMLKGKERILLARRELTDIASPYDEKSDVSMVNGNDNSTFLLEENMVAIFFPGEPHKPGLSVDKSEHIKKVIFKIEV